MGKGGMRIGSGRPPIKVELKRKNFSFRLSGDTDKVCESLRKAGYLPGSLIDGFLHQFAKEAGLM